MIISSKLSNIQTELLKLYANNVSEVDLVEIKKILASYFARKLEIAFDDYYDENNLTPDIVESWANEHNRLAN